MDIIDKINQTTTTQNHGELYSPVTQYMDIIDKINQTTTTQNHGELYSPVTLYMGQGNTVHHDFVLWSFG